MLKLTSVLGLQRLVDIQKWPNLFYHYFVRPRLNQIFYSNLWIIVNDQGEPWARSYVKGVEISLISCHINRHFGLADGGFRMTGKCLAKKQIFLKSTCCELLFHVRWYPWWAASWVCFVTLFYMNSYIYIYYIWREWWTLQMMWKKCLHNRIKVRVQVEHIELRAQHSTTMIGMSMINMLPLGSWTKWYMMDCLLERAFQKRLTRPFWPSWMLVFSNHLLIYSRINSTEIWRVS